MTKRIVIEEGDYLLKHGPVERYCSIRWMAMNNGVADYMVQTPTLPLISLRTWLAAGTEFFKVRPKRTLEESNMPMDDTQQKLL